MKKITTLLFLCCSFYCFSQRNLITLSTGYSLFFSDQYSPLKDRFKGIPLQFSYENRFSKNFSFGVNFGLQGNQPVVTSYTTYREVYVYTIRQKLLEFRPTLRYYFNKNEGCTGFHLGVNMGYEYLSIHTEDLPLITPLADPLDKFGFGMGAVFGFRKPIKKNVLFSVHGSSSRTLLGSQDMLKRSNHQLFLGISWAF